MKQTLLHNALLLCSLGLFCGLALLSNTSQAQEQPSDTIQTGYGYRSTASITEKLTTLKTTDFNQGLITTPEQLITGKVAGLRVVQRGGAPGQGAELTLRNGTTLFNSNTPLIVLDGVPLPEVNISEHSGILNFINPNDIASITVLKDAVSAAVYGGRAANGVLLITTKQAAKGAPTRVDFSSTAAISGLVKKTNVLSANQFREVITRELPDKAAMLGTHSTDWQDVIYRKAFSHDQQLSISGSLLNALPYRVSAGHLNQNGILKNSQRKQNSLTVSVSPSLLNDHLRLNVHTRYVDQQIRVAEKFVLRHALSFDPTQPVYTDNRYGGYFAYLDNEGRPNNFALLNPLSLLEQRENVDAIRTLHAQAHLQYKLHFYPALSLHARYALQNQRNDYSSFSPADMAAEALTKGRKYTYDRSADWNLKEGFLELNQPLGFMQSQLRFVAGASIRELEKQSNTYPEYNAQGEIISNSYSYSRNEYRDASLFAQMAFTLRNRYAFDAAFSSEKSSFYPITQKAGQSIGFGASWDLTKENFLEGNKAISNLSWYANFNHLLIPNHIITTYNTSSNIFIEESKYGEISKFATGLTWVILGDKIQGDLRYFTTRGSNLQLFSPYYGGNNYYMLRNDGEYKTAGVESTINYRVVNKPEFSWSVGSNISYSKSEVTNLGQNITFLSLGGEKHGLVLATGRPANSFIVFEQLYDNNGRPIERSYKKDKSGNPEKQFQYSADPTLLFGVTSDIKYKNFSVGMLLRGNAGNYVFKDADAYRSSLQAAYGYRSLENISARYLQSGFKSLHTQSDYFLENASFARLEYLQFGYDFGRVWKERASLKATATAQNAFVITKYSGQDPEVLNGFDRDQHPMPRTFSVGLQLNI